MTQISLADAYSKGELTDEGHSERACHITQLVVSVLMLLTFVGSLVGLIKLHQAIELYGLSAPTWAVIAIPAGIVGGMSFGVMFCAPGCFGLTHSLSDEEMKKFVKQYPKMEQKKTEPVDDKETPFEKPLLSRVKSVLGCCFHQMIKEGSIQIL